MTDFVRSLPFGSLAATKRMQRVHIDPLLVIPLALIALYGMVVLNGSFRDVESALFGAQSLRLGLAFGVMFIAAQLPPRFYVRWAPIIYGTGVVLLLAVLLFGVTVKGSQRWLEIPGVTRFQPSEIMKIAVPLMVAWYFRDRPLPPRVRDLAVALAIVFVPAILVIRQPDLGTGLLISVGGLSVIVLAGLSWRWIAGGRWRGLRAPRRSPGSSCTGIRDNAF